jgi:fatty acid kinase fatty acid binding subunit
MRHATVLVIEPQAERRKELARGLSSLGYEVIPALDEDQGRRFAAELTDAVVVAPLGFLTALAPSPQPDATVPSAPLAPPATSLAAAATSTPSPSGDGSAVATLLGSAPRGLPRLLLLGESDEEGEHLPAEIAYLATGGLATADLLRRVHVLLLGREVGMAADARLESLVGDLGLVPFLELLRSLQRAEVSARMAHAAGEVILVGGQVVGAAAGASLGIKAFCRLSHLDSGPVHVHPAPADDDVALGRAGGERQIDADTSSLIIFALEDRVRDAPDRRARLRLDPRASAFGPSLTAAQSELMAAIAALTPAAVGPMPTVGRLLDALPATDGHIVRELQELAASGAVRIEEADAAVCVVTDSTADLPQAVARAHGIRVAPLLVIFGDRIFHDGVDLGSREFYDRLAGGATPRTNPPPRAELHKVFRDAAAQRDVVALHLSEKLSQTFANAHAVAAEMKPSLASLRPVGEPAPSVEVLDSGSISVGLGLQVLFAARLAQRGVDAATIVRRVAELRQRTHVLFAVDTLEYLARGGRIGKARALVGKLLGLKPILGIVGGEVVAVDRVRGSRAAQPRLVHLFAQRIDAKRPIVVAIGHANAPTSADQLRSLLEERFMVAEMMVTEIGPVVGAHAGPGTVGAALFQPTEEELTMFAPLGESS